MTRRKFEFSSADRAYPETEGRIDRTALSLGGRGEILTVGATAPLTPETERRAALTIIHHMKDQPQAKKRDVLLALGLIREQEAERYEAA